MHLSIFKEKKTLPAAKAINLSGDIRAGLRGEAGLAAIVSELRLCSEIHCWM